MRTKGGGREAKTGTEGSLTKKAWRGAEAKLKGQSEQDLWPGKRVGEGRVGRPTEPKAKTLATLSARSLPPAPE